jgi:hypothetical protein
MAAPWKLGMFQSAGPMGMWKLPENRSTDYLDLEYWVTMARRCEQAGVDFLFLADDYGYPIVDDAVPAAAIRGAIQFPKADPMAILPALAAVTDRLGLAVTHARTHRLEHRHRRRSERVRAPVRHPADRPRQALRDRGRPRRPVAETVGGVVG